MVEYNTVNAKLSNLQLNKVESAMENKHVTTLRMNARIFSANKLPHELLLTTRQTTKLRNPIENNVSTGMKFSKTQISKIIQSGGFLGALLSKLPDPLVKAAVLLTKNILATLGITAAASAIDAGIQKKINCSGTITLITSNKEINDIMKIVQALEGSNSLSKGVIKTNKRRLFIYVIRHFRSIFVGKPIIRKRNCKSKRRNCKSWLWLFN